MRIIKIKTLVVCVVFMSAYTALGYDHLLPIVPEDHECEYMEKLSEKLFLSADDLGRMRVVSDEGIDYSVALHKSENKECYFITYTKAEYPLYRSFLNDQWEDDVRDLGIPAFSEVAVLRLDVEVDKEFAMLVSSVWREFILKTRYPGYVDESMDTMDSAIYEFSVFESGIGTMRGRAYNPQGETLNGFIDLSEKLVELCRVADSKRNLLKHQIWSDFNVFHRKLREGDKQKGK